MHWTIGQSASRAVAVAPTLHRRQVVDVAGEQIKNDRTENERVWNVVAVAINCIYYLIESLVSI